MNKKLAFVAALVMIATFGVFAADLTIATQVNLKDADYANNFFSFKGGNGTAEKDVFVLGADATSGASKLESTVVFNSYRTDVKGKKLIPAGLRGFFLYGVSDMATRQADAVNVTKAANGALVIQMIHRGTAYKMTTDAAGKLSLPEGSFLMRVIGTTSNVVHPDFSATGKSANIDWAKVWDASVVDGKVIGTTTTKTGKIVADAPASDLFFWQGALQVTFDGTYVKTAGEFNVVKK